MNIFIDCEFNEFRGELISMALVDMDGNAWYHALECKNPGAWVAQHVMPILLTEPVPITVFQMRLQAYLTKYQSIHIIADWPEDIVHFCQALIIGPGMRMDTPPLTMEVRRDLDAESLLPHNALYDAEAIRLRYLELTA